MLKSVIFLIIFQQTNSSSISYLPSGVDLALLSFANHSIMTYGTFGMWGALIAGRGETIMPTNLTRTDVGKAIERANIPNWRFL